MDPEKVKSILEWEAPSDPEAVTNFLGFANFYRQFIPAFIQIALPITELLRMKGGRKKSWPNQPLNWTMECQVAFEKFRGLFVAELVLKYPDPEEPFAIQADASDVAVGDVLLQWNKERNLQLYAYTSCKLNET